MEIELRDNDLSTGEKYKKRAEHNKPEHGLGCAHSSAVVKELQYLCLYILTDSVP